MKTYNFLKLLFFTSSAEVIMIIKCDKISQIVLSFIGKFLVLGSIVISYLD